MARAASSYRAARRNRGWCRMPGLIAKKHQLQLAKRANQRALFAAVTWAAPIAPTRSVYVKTRRSGWFDHTAERLSPLKSRHA